MKCISKAQAHKVFKYGTHEQLERSIKRWIKQGIAKNTDLYYEVNADLVNNAMQLEINIKNGAFRYTAGAVVVPDDNGWYLLGASL